MSPMHAYATLALSLIVFALSIGLSVLGTSHDSLFAEAGRVAAAPAASTPAR